MSAKAEYQAMRIAQEALLRIIEAIGPTPLSSAIEIECGNIAAEALDQMGELLGQVKMPSVPS
jgi:hypothetical protein